MNSFVQVGLSACMSLLTWLNPNGFVFLSSVLSALLDSPQQLIYFSDFPDLLLIGVISMLCLNPFSF